MLEKNFDHNSKQQSAEKQKKFIILTRVRLNSLKILLTISLLVFTSNLYFDTPIEQVYLFFLIM